jgi:sarcosine oxidase, subunit alpha
VGRARVSFTFDGRRVEGVDGEPVAVSLLAAGRRTLSRSFRFHRPRGLMCSTGQCGWCECEVDGRPSVRTCRVPVREGMVVRGEHAWPLVERDLLRVLDLGSRFVPPTFYHHRFLRPRVLRKWYLDVIRWFGGRGRLGDGSSVDRGSRRVRQDAPDVLVVGGGAGGLSAAIAAAEAGARVVVLEAEAAPAPAGSAGDGDLLALAPAGLGVEVRFSTVATGWYSGVVTAVDGESIWEIRPRAVVAALGSYELVPAVPGSDRPGVIGARLAARLLAEHRVLPGERAVLVGDGMELTSVGAAFREAGAAVMGPIPTTALQEVGGRGAVAWVVYRGDQGAARRESADVVVFGDRTPNLDLVIAAGGRVGWVDGRLAAQTDPDGRTSASGLFAVGDTASPDPEATAEAARRAGRAAVAFASLGSGAQEQTGRGWPSAVAATHATRVTRTGDPPRSPTDGQPPKPGSPHAVLCFCEDVRGWEIQAERAAGYADPELVKRRTGALTGPCQGKYCLSAITCAFNDGNVATPSTGDVLLPTGRPPLRPLRLGDLVVEDPA